MFERFVWIALGLVAVGRFFVPTRLDWSPTSVYKDVAHIVVGLGLATIVYRRDMTAAVIVVLAIVIEIVMVVTR